jgi:hypothetical protein
MVDPHHIDEHGHHHGKHDAATTNAVATRVFLQPIAPPAILGLWGFSIACFIVGAWLAGWFGTSFSMVYIAPFAFWAGGLLQIVACCWAFHARDAFSTVAWGIWGALWFAFGLLWFFVALGLIPAIVGHFSEFAIWFIPLAVLSLLLMGAALLENAGLFLVFLFVSVASILMAAAYFWHPDNDCNTRNNDNDPNNDCEDHHYHLRQAAGYFFVFAAAVAMYTGLWMLLAFMSGRDLVPMYRFRWAEKRPRIHGGENDPGVKKCM